MKNVWFAVRVIAASWSMRLDSWFVGARICMRGTTGMLPNGPAIYVMNFMLQKMENKSAIRSSSCHAATCISRLDKTSPTLYSLGLFFCKPKRLCTIESSSYLHQYQVFSIGYVHMEEILHSSPFYL